MKNCPRNLNCHRKLRSPTIVNIVVLGVVDTSRSTTQARFRSTRSTPSWYRYASEKKQVFRNRLRTVSEPHLPDKEKIYQNRSQARPKRVVLQRLWLLLSQSSGKAVFCPVFQYHWLGLPPQSLAALALSMLAGTKEYRCAAERMCV